MSEGKLRWIFRGMFFERGGGSLRTGCKTLLAGYEGGHRSIHSLLSCTVILGGQFESRILFRGDSKKILNSVF